jgi:hypothetical protein
VRRSVLVRFFFFTHRGDDTEGGMNLLRQRGDCWLFQEFRSSGRRPGRRGIVSELTNRGPRGNTRDVGRGIAPSQSLGRRTDQLGAG